MCPGEAGAVETPRGGWGGDQGSVLRERRLHRDERGKGGLGRKGGGKEKTWSRRGGGVR